jgi:hypothetical protein
MLALRLPTFEADPIAAGIAVAAVVAFAVAWVARGRK